MSAASMDPRPGLEADRIQSRTSMTASLQQLHHAAGARWSLSGRGRIPARSCWRTELRLWLKRVTRLRLVSSADRLRVATQLRGLVSDNLDCCLNCSTSRSTSRLHPSCARQGSHAMMRVDDRLTCSHMIVSVSEYDTPRGTIQCAVGSTREPGCGSAGEPSQAGGEARQRNQVAARSNELTLRQPLHVSAPRGFSSSPPDPE